MNHFPHDRDRDRFPVPDDRPSNGKRPPSPPYDETPEWFHLPNRPVAGAEKPTLTKKFLRRAFVILLAIGLVLGSILAVGVVSLLKHWGLTDVPARVEQR